MLRCCQGLLDNLQAASNGFQAVANALKYIKIIIYTQLLRAACGQALVLYLVITLLLVVFYSELLLGLSLSLFRALPSVFLTPSLVGYWARSPYRQDVYLLQYLTLLSLYCLLYCRRLLVKQDNFSRFQLCWNYLPRLLVGSYCLGLCYLKSLSRANFQQSYLQLSLYRVPLQMLLLSFVLINLK